MTSVHKTDASWEVSNGSEIITADRVISTIPLQVLLPTLEDIPVEIQEAVHALRYNSIACISVGFKGEVPDISWMYVPEDKFNKI